MIFRTLNTMYILVAITTNIRETQQLTAGFGPPIFDEYMQNIQDSSLIPAEWNMTTVEIVRFHGYPIEEHVVVSKDGYIMTVHRIPHGKKNYTGKPRNPTILQHGLFATSSCWVLNKPEQNLAYKLADAGYDVWLANVRGNKYGKQHVKLSIDYPDFWRFSFHEMGVYDMPAIIDYVLKTTGYKQVNYIGHSMGTTIIGITLSTRPEYNKKVRMAILLAPVFSLKYTTSLVQGFNFLLPIIPLLEGFSTPLNTDMARSLYSMFCQSPRHELCNQVVFTILGLNHDQLDPARFPVIASHYPEETSFQTFIHYCQLYKHSFRMYDYRWNNHKKYGQDEPPEYKLQKISAPLAIFWSDDDIVANSAQVANFVIKLNRSVYEYKVPSERFSHTDYLIAKEADKLVYNKILEILE